MEREPAAFERHRHRRPCEERMALGTDNLFHSETIRKVALRFRSSNVTNNKVALYNSLSTFSGTHFVPPRTTRVSVTHYF